MRAPLDTHRGDTAYACLLNREYLEDVCEVASGLRPLIVVRRKADDVGTLTVQDQPRFYFGFEPYDNGQHEGE